MGLAQRKCNTVSPDTMTKLTQDTVRHDDITYQSIAKAFGLKLVEHQDALERMKRLSKPHASQPDFSYDVPSPALEAKKRMIRLPLDTSRDDKDQVLFVDESLWVPIAVVNGNIHILPGVPRLFEKLLEGLKPGLVPRLTDPEGEGVYRILISTPVRTFHSSSCLHDFGV